MKKGRPGTLIRVLCKIEDTEDIVKLIFKHTSTIGIRKAILDRYVLDRRIETIDSPCGPVRKKISTGYGITREKYEFDDVAKLADSENTDLKSLIYKIENNR